ncbi:MAG: hypothetical protein Q9170_002522 [Blastenia crenularia]
MDDSVPGFITYDEPITCATEEECRLANLNDSIELLSEIFSNVLPEVFREMLVRFEGESQIEYVINQILRHGDKWVKGRWKDDVERAKPSSSPKIPDADFFRRESYKWAVKVNLLQEFKNLSKSTVKAVLAEKNYSYSLARPVLQDIDSKTYRRSISKFFTRWSRSSDDVSEKHGMIRWIKSAEGERVPILKETGDPELDQELQQTLIAPFYAQYKIRQEARDCIYAEKINEQEARDSKALFECGCCFSTGPFERIATCTTGNHVLCFKCIFRAVSEALFGQSWGQSIDHNRGLLRCLAPTEGDACSGCIPHDIAQRAVSYWEDGAVTWQKFQFRLAEQALTKAKIPLVRCPVCSYAEIPDIYLPPRLLQYSINTKYPFLGILLALLTLPFLTIYFLLTFLPITLPPFSILFNTALTNLSQATHFPTRFKCRSPTCLTTTCLHCSLPWRDPHTCFTPASASDTNTLISLRTTIDSARTAALKRTCPVCGTSFIKASGCNKLTCPCGYIMCYICRQGLGPGVGNEGYGHYCQHFRADAEKICKKCEKCDLYRDEDEDEAVRLAGVRAEREWRERRGLLVGGVAEARSGIGAGKGEEKERWSLQRVVDWWVGQVVVSQYQTPGIVLVRGLRRQPSFSERLYGFE